MGFWMLLQGQGYRWLLRGFPWVSTRGSPTPVPEAQSHLGNSFPCLPSCLKCCGVPCRVQPCSPILWQEDSRLVLTRSPSRIPPPLIPRARRNGITTRRKRNLRLLPNHRVRKDLACSCTPKLLPHQSLGRTNEASSYRIAGHDNWGTGLPQGEHSGARA